MNFIEAIIKEIEKLKNRYELNDLFNEIVGIKSRNYVDINEYNQRINEYYKKYFIEMNIIFMKDNIIANTGDSKLPRSYKDSLIDILISIAAIKVFNKIDKQYNAQEINNYDYILNNLKSIND